jgi:hypothetical protein
MKIFDFKNPSHVQILREEVQRVKKILAEGYKYSETEIWDAMSEDERYNAILATRDDDGPDLADQYADQSWDQIPDDITNGINLSDYQLAKYSINFGTSNLRAIDSFKKSDPDVTKLVDAFIKSVGRKDLLSLTVDQSTKLLLAIHKLRAAKSPQPVRPASGTSKNNPYDMPGGRPSTGYMGAKYTGD